MGEKQQRVLCIDADEVNQIVLQGLLMERQYKYIRATSGEEGLQAVMADKEGPPDLVLIDCSLPGEATGLSAPLMVILFVPSQGRNLSCLPLMAVSSI